MIHNMEELMDELVEFQFKEVKEMTISTKLIYDRELRNQ